MAITEASTAPKRLVGIGLDRRRDQRAPARRRLSSEPVVFAVFELPLQFGRARSARHPFEHADERKRPSAASRDVLAQEVGGEILGGGAALGSLGGEALGDVVRKRDPQLCHVTKGRRLGGSHLERRSCARSCLPVPARACTGACTAAKTRLILEASQALARASTGG